MPRQSIIFSILVEYSAMSGKKGIDQDLQCEIMVVRGEYLQLIKERFNHEQKKDNTSGL